LTTEKAPKLSPSSTIIPQKGGEWINLDDFSRRSERAYIWYVRSDNTEKAPKLSILHPSEYVD